jgi:hypothetical protein
MTNMMCKTYTPMWVAAAAEPMRGRRRPVLIETPYSDKGTEAIRYLACCLLDSIDRGEAPLASHALYPLALPEHVPGGREVGLACRDALAALTRYVVAYLDLGVTEGMCRSYCHETRMLRGRAKETWESGQWPSEARWSRTNEGLS